jgi:hypothetical protein
MDITPEKRVGQPLKIGYMDRPAGWQLAPRKISGRAIFFGKVMTILEQTRRFRGEALLGHF